MEDMIKKIIELDKQAQADLVQVNQLKVDSARKISEMKDKKRDEYIKKARTNIDTHEKQEKIKAFIKLKSIENTHKESSNRIDKIYNENKDKWVNSIVARVIES